MSATIDGATVGVLADLGDATMILGRDHLGDIMHGVWESMTDLGCDVMEMSWVWGAREAMGPLTEVRAGTLTATLYDPERTFDPANAASPYASFMRVGRLLRITVDGTPAWSGTIYDWSYSHARQAVTFNAEDQLEELSRRPVSIIMAAGPAGTQVEQLLRYAGVRARFFGGSSAQRSSHAFRSSLYEALFDARFAELGSVWVDHEGYICWAGRGWVPSGPERALIGDQPGAVGCEDVVTYMEPAAVRNLVRIDRFDPAGTNLAPVIVRAEASIAKYGERPVITAEEELDLA